MVCLSFPDHLKQRWRIIAFAGNDRIPAVMGLREYAPAGRLATIGANRQNVPPCARDLDQLRRGAKPGDLPVEQPTRFELILNMKTRWQFGSKSRRQFSRRRRGDRGERRRLQCMNQKMALSTRTSGYRVTFPEAKPLERLSKLSPQLLADAGPNAAPTDALCAYN